MIETILGPMPETALRKVTRVWNNAHEYTVRTEYHFGGQEVRSDVHVTLKEIPSLFGEQGALNG